MPTGTAPSSSEWAGSLAWTCAEESLQNCLSSIGPFHFWHSLDNKFNLSSHLMLISNFLHPGFWITANMPLGIANRINNQHPYHVNVWLDPVLHSGVIISHKFSCRKTLLFAGELHILWFFLFFIFLFCKPPECWFSLHISLSFKLPLTVSLSYLSKWDCLLLL